VVNAKKINSKSTLKLPLIFCPTYNTTRELFEILYEPKRKSMIYGGYGIGKTIGIIMFSQLVSFKAKFMIEAKKDSKKKQELK
jgi:hypothetical protein